jgi:NADH-quinone oxidoreductase subunit H
LASILFFGGWNGPIPITHLLGIADSTNPILHYLANLMGCINLIGKAVFGVTFMMWVRWTLPRLRIDQVMTTCLKYCTPIAAVMFVGATIWKYNNIPFINNLLPMHAPGEVREFWLAEQGAATTTTVDPPEPVATLSLTHREAH